MDIDRWQRIEEIFHAAGALPRDQRPSFLDAQCADDLALRREVEGLLAADAQVENQLEEAVEGVFSLAAAEAGEEPLERQRIGPYRVLRELGRGGLSTVFLGQRDDEDFPLKVAIKVVKRGMDTRDILRRLRQERRILASLDHPNISRLMDGGSTEDGLPYFVMEYIEGQTIEAYCEHHNLDIEGRLNLFRQVCAAVHYAHQSLIVHRDIKPGNLMVTHDGIPKLLDFGIAKLMAPDVGGTPAPVAATATAAGLRLLTPEYASPEQVRGETLTTATDVYSLGVLLYRLLTGELPYEVNRLSLNDLERVICEHRPERPSTVVIRRGRERRAWGLAEGGASAADGAETRQTERLGRRLRGDLDNILLMALRKEPQRRYASAQQLAEDLQRYQEGLPIAARRDTFGYRTSKFVRRNRLGVSAAALVFLSLLVGIFATTYQAKLAQQERQRAERNLAVAETQRAKAEQVTDFFVGLFEIADPGEARGSEVTAREILDEGAQRIGEELEGEPEVRSAMMATMGVVYYNLGLYPQAERLLEGALDDRRRLFGEAHVDVAASYDHLGSLLRAQGDYQASRERFEEALRLYRMLLGDTHPRVADTLNDLAVLEDAQGHYDEAEALFRESLAVRIETLGEDDLEVAETLNNLAAIETRRRRLPEAEALFQRALEIRRRNYPEGVHPRIATTLNNLAVIYQLMERFEASEAAHLEVLALRRQLFGEAHPDVGSSLNNLAQVRRSLGNLEGAEEANREAVEIYRRAADPGLVFLTYNRGEILTDLGRTREAEALFEESLELRRNLFAADHPRLSYPMTQLGRLALGRDDRGAAESWLRQSLELQMARLPEDDPDLAETHAWLGLTLLGVDPPAAKRYLTLSDEVLQGQGVAGERVRQALQNR